MASTTVQNLTNIGNIADGDVLVGERVAGTTGTLTINGILYDADFSSNGLMTRTASATYTNRTITGTAGTISVTNGNGVSGNPTLTIDATYVGQTSITTLGTVSSGTWNASTIPVLYGGTGATSATAYALLAGGTSSTNPHQSLSTGSANQVLQSTGASSLPAYSTATYPSTTSSGTILGSTSNNVITALTDIPTSITIGSAYVYRASGTDVVVSDGGTGVSSLTAYAVICGGTTATDPVQALASVGTSGQVLTSNGASALPTWQTGAGGLTAAQSFAVNLILGG